MKRPFVTEEKIRWIASRYPTPFYLYDEASIRANDARIKQAFSWNPGYREYFAVKATPTPAILNIMKDLGSGLDCSSYSELKMAAGLGFQGSDIMFSSSDTPAEGSILARNLNAAINFDDISHIAFFERCGSALPKTVSCRYNQGGVGIPYRPDDRANDIFTIANSVMKVFCSFILEEFSEFRLHNHRLSANISTVL